jgi:hypothetical protein
MDKPTFFPIRNHEDLLRYFRQKGYEDPLFQVLWWGSHMRSESMGEMNRRECVEMFFEGVKPTTVEDVDEQLEMMRENIAYDFSERTGLEISDETGDAPINDEVWRYFEQEWE